MATEDAQERKSYRVFSNIAGLAALAFSSATLWLFIAGAIKGFNASTAWIADHPLAVASWVTGWVVTLAIFMLLSVVMWRRTVELYDDGF